MEGNGIPAHCTSPLSSAYPGGNGSHSSALLSGVQRLASGGFSRQSLERGLGLAPTADDKYGTGGSTTHPGSAKRSVLNQSLPQIGCRSIRCRRDSRQFCFRPDGRQRLCPRSTVRLSFGSWPLRRPLFYSSLFACGRKDGVSLTAVSDSRRCLENPPGPKALDPFPRQSQDTTVQRRSATCENVEDILAAQASA